MKTLKYFMMTLVISILLCFAIDASDAPVITGNAGIRTDEPVGIRVSAEIASRVAKDKNTTEYGFIVTRKAFLKAKGIPAEHFTLDSPVGYSKGVSKGVVNGVPVDIYNKKTSTKVYFSCSISGITPYYYMDVLVVRPYVVFSERSEYGAPLEISMYDVAKGICCDEDAFDRLSQTERDKVSEIVNDTKCVVSFIAGRKLFHQEYVGVGEKAPVVQTVPETPVGMSFAGWSLYSDNDLDKMIRPSSLTIEKHTRVYAVIVTEFMEKLHRGWIQLDGIIATGLQKDALAKIKECIGHVLEDAKNGIETDKDYVKETYTEYVEGVKKIVKNDMTEKEQSQFANIITKRVDEDVREFLTHYFDIDVSVK